MEKPCVVSNVTGNCDVIKNKVNGYMCNTVDEFVNAIESCRNYVQDNIIKEAKENIAEKAKTAYNIAIAVLAVAILILEAYSAERYNQSNCSASRFCSGSDDIQFYDKSDE